jgi:N-acetylglucosaminyldiphosphoundecaprenol N-acetyl-beta-D-mannosaminyltransferase
MKIDIAGVQVDNVTNAETLERIYEFVKSGRSHYITTVYSEFIVEAQANHQFKSALNNADLSVPDGIGILWAAKFLSMPKRDPIVIFFNWLGSLMSIILSPQSVRTVIKEQVTGSRLVWDIAKLAERNNYSLALFGGLDGVAEKAAQKLQEKFPRLKINLAVSDRPFDEQAVQRISSSNSDILLVAYQPPKQEIWLSDNIQKLNVKVGMGLGGTFDYISGKFEQPPDWMHQLGLEWFWRLTTQPWRWQRIWNAVGRFSWIIYEHKLRQ